jgi:Arylsulfotransferase (ASST)
MTNPGDLRLTRRGFLIGAGAAAAALTAPPAWAGQDLKRARAATGRAYVSRPDLQPPLVHVTELNAPSAGRVLLAPFDLGASVTGKPSAGQFGALIVDDNGFPLWFHPSKPGLTIIDLRTQKLRGKPVLTWYEGHVLDSYGGEWVIADQSYRSIARIKAGNGYRGDLHECLITSRATALITIYAELAADLTSIGGPANGKVVEGVIQEIEIRTGRVLFEWHSLAEIALIETYSPEVGAAGNVDYFHLNSIGVDYDGHLLVSARNTCTIYKLNRETGAVIWRLGGKKSDFALGPGVEFGYQHDARRHDDGTITLFDNAAFAPGPSGALRTTSRPLRLSLDDKTMTASLVEEYRVDDARIAFAMGNLQQLADRSAFVGWGTVGAQSEIGQDGTVHWDSHFDPGVASYRAYRSRWVGRPTTKPDIVTRSGFDGESYVYVSWNGATEVHYWRALVGLDSPRHLRTVTRRGFETAIPLRGAHFGSGPVWVEALDAKHRVIGRSEAISLPAS